MSTNQDEFSTLNIFHISSYSLGTINDIMVLIVVIDGIPYSKFT